MTTQFSGDAVRPPLTPAERTYLVRHVVVVFLGCLSIGAPLPVLAQLVHESLGFGALAVGLVIGLQSIATVLTRHRAGTLADAFGPRRAVVLGLPALALAGPFYLAAAMPTLPPEGRLAMLIPARLLLGIGESLLQTGAMSWGIGTLGAARAGTVMSWQGIAIYAAFGLGAPIGLWVYEAAGLSGLALLTTISPLLALPLLLGMRSVVGAGSERVPFTRVVALIWRQGLVLTLATVPFAAMATFLALDFSQKGWRWTGLALAAFSGGYVLVRLVASHLPDRYGGARVAMWSLAVETLGQLTLWLAPDPIVAIVGAILSGAGFSLVFPAMGVDATRRVPANQRGRAVGNFIAFFDIAIGVTGPLVGLVVAGGNTALAFAIGAGASVSAVALLAVDRNGDA